MATAAVQRSSCTRRAASRVRHWSREVPPTVFPRLASTTGSDTWTSMQRFCGSCCSRAYKVVPKHEEGGALSTPTAPSEPSLAISVFRFMGVLLTLVFMITTHSMLVSRECPHRHPRASQDFKLFESPFRAHDEAHRSVPTPGTASAPVGVPDGSGHHVIGDVFFYLTRDLNVWLHDNSHIADWVLITHAMLYDFLSLHFSLWSIFSSRTARPIVAMFIIFALRTAAQMSVHLPCPPGLYWKDPGVPSLSIDYTPAADFFFSGHTSSLVVIASEYWSGGRERLSTLVWIALPFIMLLVLTTRVHYTVDVITALLAAFFATWCAAVWETIVSPESKLCPTCALLDGTTTPNLGSRRTQ